MTSFTAWIPPKLTLIPRADNHGTDASGTAAAAARVGTAFAIAGTGASTPCDASRRSAQSSTTSRSRYMICMSPPGKYISRISSPMLLVNSRTCGVSLKSTGRPRTQSAPITGPAIDPSPPITAVATTRNDSSGPKACVGVTCSRTVMSRQPPSAAIPPEIANERTFSRLGATVDAAAMSSFSRMAIIERPMPVRRNRATTIVVSARTPTHR